MNFAIDRFLQFSFCVWIENLVFGTFIDKQTKNNYTRFDLFANIVQVLLKTIQNFHHRLTWPNINSNNLYFSSSSSTFISSKDFFINIIYVLNGDIFPTYNDILKAN